MNVFSMVPVNKTAAVVVSQAGCSKDDNLSDEQLRENLVAKVRLLNAEVKTLKKNSKERKQIGREIAAINAEITKIRPARKCKGLESYFIDAVRDNVSGIQFRRFMDIASEKWRQDHEGDVS